MIHIKGSVLLLVVLFGAVSSQKNTSFPDLICPDWPQGRTWVTWANRTCTRDRDCPDPKLCCFDGEDRHCTDPVPGRLGPSECRYKARFNDDECRAQRIPVNRRCSTDDDCLRTEACCPQEVCSWVCLDRRVERPGAPPVIIGETDSRNNYWTGTGISLLCSGKGEGLQTVTWYKTKDYWYLKPLREAHIVTKITRGGRRIQSELRIPNSSCDDHASGEYKCSIKTELGRSSSLKTFIVSVYNRTTASICDDAYESRRYWRGER